MILATTSSKVVMTTSSTADTSVSASWSDMTSTTLTGDNDNTLTNSATSTDIIGSPAASTQRQIKNIKVYNYDATDSNTYTIAHTDGTISSVVYRRTLAPYESFEYDGSKWVAYDANGVPIVITASITPVLNRRYLISGALAETFDRNLCDEVNSAVLSSGRLSGAAIWLEAGMTISSISFHSATTAAGTPTNQLFGLFDSSRNLLRSSTNDTTTAWAANSLKTLALTSTFTTTYSGLYYLGIMVTATTVPTLKGNTAMVGGQLQAQAPSMGGTSNTGLTTALPATANAFGTVTTSFWGCVS